MDTRRVFLFDAFTTEPLSGNQAGLIPDAEGLKDEAMAAIARELNASETAFLFPSDDGARQIRYFTPTGEIDLCGHATIAAGAWLSDADKLDGGTHTFETNVGAVDVELDDGTVWMDGTRSTVSRIDLSYKRLANALGADPATLTDIGADLPLATASAGLKYLIVPMNFLEALSGLDPDYEAISELSAELDVTGVYAFTFDTIGREVTLHGRMFGPAVGVNEDPVTGTASGAVAAYLRKFEAFDGEFPEEMLFEQGHFIDRPGTVRVRAQADPIAIGGRAVTAVDGTVSVPDFGDDEIIEV